MNAGIRDLSITFGSKIVTLLLHTGVQSCLAWFLAPAGRGSYAVCVLFATLLILFCVLGCDVAAMYYVSARKFTLSEGVSNACVHGGLGCLLAIAVGFAIMQFPLSFLEKAARSSFYLSLALIPASFFSGTLTSLLGSLRQFGWLAISHIFSISCQLVLVVVMVPVLGWGVNGALLSTLGTALLTIAAVLVFYRRRHQLTWVRPSRQSLSQMLHYGLRYYLGKISNQVNFQIGTIILAFFATREEIGLFAVAMTLTAQVMMVPDTLTTVLIPRVAEDKVGRIALIAQCARVAGVVVAILLAVLAIFATPMVSILFSPQFLPAVPLIRIIAVGILVRSAGKLFVPYLIGTNHPGIASVSVAAGMVTNLVLLLALMPYLGLMGAAVAVSVGYLVSSAILQIAFCRISGQRFRETWRFTVEDWRLVKQIFGKTLERVGIAVPEDTVLQ